MQRIAAQVGYSEIAFVAPVTGREKLVRYSSPEAEVPFCGHATIAAGIALAAEGGGDGVYQLETLAGQVPVSVRSRDGERRASFTSVTPRYVSAPADLVSDALSALGWDADSLDPAIPSTKAFAGAWHLILASASIDRLNELDYNFDRLKAIMLSDDLTTLQLIWRQSATLFHSRNPFPVAGIVEDFATGVVAAALGGYLREAKLIKPPAAICTRQGKAMGRPSFLDVEITESGGIVVSGTAVPIEGRLQA